MADIFENSQEVSSAYANVIDVMSELIQERQAKGDYVLFVFIAIFGMIPILFCPLQPSGLVWQLLASSPIENPSKNNLRQEKSEIRIANLAAQPSLSSPACWLASSTLFGEASPQLPPRFVRPWSLQLQEPLVGSFWLARRSSLQPGGSSTPSG